MMYQHSSSYPHRAPHVAYRASATTTRPHSPNIVNTEATHAIRRAELALKESERARQEQERKARRTLNQRQQHRRSLELLDASSVTTQKAAVASPRLVKSRSNPILTSIPSSSAVDHPQLASTRARSRSHATLSSANLSFLPVPPNEPSSKFSNSTGKSSSLSTAPPIVDKRIKSLSLGKKLLKTPSRLALRKKASRADTLRPDVVGSTSSTSTSSASRSTFFRRSPSRLSNLSAAASHAHQQETSAPASIASGASSQSRKWTDRIKAAFSTKSSASTASSGSIVNNSSGSPGVVHMAERVSLAVQTRRWTHRDGIVFEDFPRDSIESGRFSDAPSDGHFLGADDRRYSGDHHQLLSLDTRTRPISNADSYLSSASEAPSTFRSPSPARFRDLAPSPTAGSPDRDARGLPVRSSSAFNNNKLSAISATSTRSSSGMGSPKKSAMGPEQLISVLAADSDAPTAVQRVCGATSDLAELLTGFEDTVNVTMTNVIVVPGAVDSAQQHDPKLQPSLDSLRSTVSDVPEDLKMILAQSADADDDDDFEEANTALDISAAGATFTSFEGKATTAASALKHLLVEQHFGTSRSGDDFGKSSVSTLADSIKDYIRMERPTMGEKMFESQLVALPSLISPSTIASTRKRPGESISTVDSPSPPSAAVPRLGLVRYSRAHVTQPSVSTTASSADPGDLTNVSLASLMSSPCPRPSLVNSGSKIPMLTCRPPVAPNFRFPAPARTRAVKKSKSTSRLTTMRKSGSVPKLRQQPSLDSLFDSKVSPRFVRPLQPVAGSVLRPRPLSTGDGVIVGPDTPPPSSSSDAASLSSQSHSLSHSRQSSLASSIISNDSFTIEHGQVVTNRFLRGGGGHSRHVSVVSLNRSVLPDTIIEENEGSRNGSPPKLARDDSDLIQITVGTAPLRVPDDMVPLDISPQRAPRTAQPRRIEPFVFANAADLVQALYFADDHDEAKTLEMRADAQEWCRFRFAADIELSRSRELYPDTPYSHEEAARFESPVTVDQIAYFLRDSQERFRSSIDSGCAMMQADFGEEEDDIEAGDQFDGKAHFEVQRDSYRSNKLYESIMKRSLGRSLGAKSEPSPFTALPPRLNIRSRANVKRVPVPMYVEQDEHEEADHRTSRQVDLAFLGDRISTRRIEQLDAARRKLEGTGRPDEQRSDGDEDDTTRSFGVNVTNARRKSSRQKRESEDADNSGTYESKGSVLHDTASFKKSKPARKTDRRRVAMSQMRI